MTRAAAGMLFAAMAWPAVAADDPCRDAPKDPEFTACWNAQFKKSETEVAHRLRVLTERHRKEEPELYRLILSAQQRWLAWREAACRVKTFESKGTPGFGVYWDRCRIGMNDARTADLQKMIDNP